MDPSMIALAQDMMSKMSPEQLAQMRSQAANMNPSEMQHVMNMFNSMTPEQRRAAQEAAANTDPDLLIKNANTAASQLSAQQKYVFDASIQLKSDGNRLHGLKQYADAAEKYTRALENLKMHTDDESTKLRLSCRSNLASCYLQLNRWEECIDQCNAVLSIENNNRKALYRRGQALLSLKRYIDARQDLHKALQLSPESEKAVIQEKLDDLEQKCKQGNQGVVIEEILDDDDEETVVVEAVPCSTTKDDSASNIQEKRREERFDGDDGSIQDTSIMESQKRKQENNNTPQTPHLSHAEQVRMASEAIKQNPSTIKQTAEAISTMSDVDLAGYMAQAGGKIAGTPEMARAAAELMKDMSPEELLDITHKGSNLDSVPSFPAGTSSESFLQSSSSLKAAAKMMEHMSPEKLEAMMAAMPAAPGGLKMNVEQMKMAAKMLENMSQEDFERMSKLAQTMPGMGMGSSGGVPSTLTSTATLPASTAAATTTNTTTRAASSVPLPTSTVPGAAPKFDPGNMSPEVMTQMRQQMANPEMLRSMQSMLKNMDPQSLSSMMQASGLNMTPEQAQRMVDQMGNISDNQLAWVAKITAIINTIIMIYQTIKAWIFSQNAMLIAVLVLLLALFIRYLGWI